MTEAILLDSVCKGFGNTRALEDVSARIAGGRLTGLVGPDGAGKTTLIRMMAGLLEPDRGQLRVAGLDPTDKMAALAESVGYMPQRFGLYEDLTVFENLELYADLRGMAKEDYTGTFKRLLDFTGLEPFTQRLAGRLSGGMQQKLGLACALITSPPVLLLDEPGVGVDPVSRQDLWRMVQALTDQGMAVIWATAYLEEAERCEDVILLNQGSIAFHGKPADLTQRLEGRCYRIRGARDKRALLSEVLTRPGVRDGTIEGRSVRVVLQEGSETGWLSDIGSPEAVPARFEDAFIDLLGGAPGGNSPLVEQMPEAAGNGNMVECRKLTKRFGGSLLPEMSAFRSAKAKFSACWGLTERVNRRRSRCSVVSSIRAAEKRGWQGWICAVLRAMPSSSSGTWPRSFRSMVCSRCARICISMPVFTGFGGAGNGPA